MEAPKVIRVLIVDDEQDSRALSSAMLNDLGMEIVGEAEDVDGALVLIKRNDPDLIFLDIEMPDKNGFDLLREMKGKGLHSDIIFVTAHDEYAIKAIKHAAFDYLMKPIDKDEMQEALLRYQRHSGKGHLEDKIDLLLRSVSQPTKIRINTRTGYLLVPFGDILYCEADGNYTKIFLTNGTNEMATQNLGKIRVLVPEDSFLRISRKHLVNGSYLFKVDRKRKVCQLHFMGKYFEFRVADNKIKDIGTIRP